VNCGIFYDVHQKKMKKYLLFVSSILFLGCKSQDKDIKQAIAVHAKEELMFAGINYIVTNGTVTLTGNCPSQELKNKLVKRIQSTSGVKSVIDKTVIGSVVLDHDFVLKQKIDSVLCRYAAVESSVKNGVVVLTGNLKKDQSEQLLQSLNRLSIKNIVNNLSSK